MLRDVIDFQEMIQDLVATLPGQDKVAWCERAGTVLRSSFHDTQLHRALDEEIPFRHRGPILTSLERLQSHVRDYSPDKDAAIAANLKAITTTLGEILVSKRGTWIYQLRDDQDVLLPLPSRAALERDKTPAHQEATSQEPLAVLLLDADFFKRINDSLGHQTGDAVLKAIATTFRTAIGTNGKTYRYGGEEFLAFLPNTTASQAVATAERIREAIKNTKIPGVQDPVTVSIGVAAHPVPDKTETADDLFKLADQRLYQAKEAGRDQVVGPATPVQPRTAQAETSAAPRFPSAKERESLAIGDVWERLQILIGDLGQLTRIDRHYPHVLHEPPEKIRHILEGEGYSATEIEEVALDASPDRAVTRVADRRRYHEARTAIRALENDLVLKRPDYPEDLWHRFTELLKALHGFLVKVSFALQGDENKRYEADDLLTNIDSKDIPSLCTAIRAHAGLTTPPMVSAGELSPAVVSRFSCTSRGTTPARIR